MRKYRGLAMAQGITDKEVALRCMLF
jgi:hypothetical protein